MRSHALFQVDNVPMANLLRGDRHSGGAAVLPGAMTSEQFAPALTIPVFFLLQHRRPTWRGRVAQMPLAAHFRMRRESLSWQTK